MKKLMIIGAADFQVPIIEYAVKKYKVVIVAPDIPAELAEKAYSVYKLDVRQEKRILEIARSEKIDGIITDQTDIPVRTVAYVAEKMNLQGIGYSVSQLFTDKAKMVERLEQVGIKTIPSVRVFSSEEAINALELDCMEGEVIVKPTDSQGSRGIFACTNKRDVEKAYNKAVSFSSDGSVIIQKRMKGREFFVEGIVLDYEVENLIIGDTTYFEDDTLFSAKQRCVPTNANPELRDRVLNLNKSIIKGLGLRQGITHSEFIMDRDDIYLIETAARGGGVYISSDIISICTGLNTEEYLTNIALGEQERMPEIKDTGKVCSYIAFFLPVGEVVSADGIDEVCNLPYVHRNQLKKIYKGYMQTKSAKDKTSRYAFIVSADTLDDLNERIKNIRKKLFIKIRKTDGSIVEPIWD